MLRGALCHNHKPRCLDLGSHLTKTSVLQKYRICLTHGSAHELVIDGRTVRWCQQASWVAAVLLGRAAVHKVKRGG